MKRSLIVKICTVAVILGIAACMFVIGRGHTVYFDAKPIEYNGEALEPGYRTAIFVNGERVARLSAGDRGMATWIGQNFRMELEITQNKGDEPKKMPVSIKLPYGLDGIVVNLPELAAGLPQEVWQSEFVPVVTVEEVDEEIITEDEMLGDF